MTAVTVCCLSHLSVTPFLSLLWSKLKIVSFVVPLSVRAWWHKGRGINTVIRQNKDKQTENKNP